MKNIILLLAGLFLFSACVTAPDLQEDAPQAINQASKKVPTNRKGMPDGYLAPDKGPNGIEILQPPPVAGSPARLADLTISKKYLKLYDMPTWDLAMRDHDLSFPAATSTYDCAAGTSINKTDTPTLVKLLSLTVIDAGLSSLEPKKHFNVERPFVSNQQPSCAGDQAEGYKKSGAYPSGHAAVGWTWALILSDMLPKRAEQIRARGRAYAQGRVVCNLHWQSDVEAGRVLGAAAYEMLQLDTQFSLDAIKAKQELLAQIKADAKPARDCATETKAIAGLK